jgi:hypothetical protein
MTRRVPVTRCFRWVWFYACGAGYPRAKAAANLIVKEHFDAVPRHAFAMCSWLVRARKYAVRRRLITTSQWNQRFGGNDMSNYTLSNLVLRHVRVSAGTVGTMNAGDNYSAKALALLAKAEVEKDPELAAEFENLARSFLLLAEQAERNTHFDISYETPPPKPREIV